MSTIYQEIVREVRRFADSAGDLASLQRFTVDLIAARLPNYHWTGFYMLDPADSGVLILGPFHGAPTEHVRIPVSQGICGAAVAQGETIVIDDVTADPRYLSCSIETRSEIVVPIWVEGEIVGEIDIDSHAAGAFGAQDRIFLEACAETIGTFISRSTAKS